MQVRLKYESDGRCAMHRAETCMVLYKQHQKCGTYLCPFYKPEGCKDWVRLDRPNSVVLIPPEEVIFERRQDGD